MTNISGFSFKVNFFDEEELYLDTDGVDIEVKATDDPEADRDEAYTLAGDWAEKHLDDYSADSFEVSLQYAY